MGTHFRGQKGFTLVEIIIVVALLGFLGVAAMGSYINSTKTFTFLANYKSMNSAVRVARSYALTNKAVDVVGELRTPDRYGVYITDTSVSTFADNGNVPLEFDKNDSIVSNKTFDFTETDYRIEAMDQNKDPFTGALVLFYEKSSGELSVFEDNSGYQLLPRSQNKFVLLRAYGDDIERFTMVFLISGLSEEFVNLPI